MRKLNRRQRDLLSYLAASVDENGQLPSLTKLHERFSDRCRTTLVNNLAALQREGLIHRNPGMNATQIRNRWATFLYKLPFEGVVK